MDSAITHSCSFPVSSFPSPWGYVLNKDTGSCVPSRTSVLKGTRGQILQSKRNFQDTFAPLKLNSGSQVLSGFPPGLLCTLQSRPKKLLSCAHPEFSLMKCSPAQRSLSSWGPSSRVSPWDTLLQLSPLGAQPRAAPGEYLTLQMYSTAL